MVILALHSFSTRGYTSADQRALLIRILFDLMNIQVLAWDLSLKYIVIIHTRLARALQRTSSLIQITKH